MSSIRRRPTHRVAMAAGALAACLALTATACSGDDGSSNDSSKPSGGGDDQALPEGAWQDVLDGLPFEIDLDAWLDGDWQDWNEDTWLRELGDYFGPIIDDLWDANRMGQAEDPEQNVDSEQIVEDPDAPDSDDPQDDRGITDPVPDPIEAVAVDTPYAETRTPVGRVFFDSPEGPMACSGAVIADPQAPGKSNLVATAGHCVHAGAAGGWYRNIIFVPSFNNDALPADDVYNVPQEEVAPFGTWWTEYAYTTTYWVDHGSPVGGDGAHGDFAVLTVTPEDGGGKSLEETVGGAYEVNFDAPAVAGLGEVELLGYPAVPPFDGSLMYSCPGPVGRLSIDATMPGMYRSGCTMTAGSSGGPWVRVGESGEPELVSVTSIGAIEGPPWMAGPRLEEEAQAVLTAVSDHNAGK